jgi:hypothetical protein
MTDTVQPIKRTIKPVKVDANKRVIPKGSPNT